MLLNTYNRFDLTFTRGEGAYIYDDKGNKYLDFVSGIAVNCLGHANEIITNAIFEQSKKLLHISNLYYSDTQMDLTNTLVSVSKMERVFYTNSGTEANELAIKIARKYGNQISNQKTKIIYMSDSFHGRSTGSLAITGQSKYKAPFEPLMPNMIECKFNDVEDLKKLVDDNVCAIILEPIQGESGIKKVSNEFIKVVKEVCDKHKCLLIFDEIQCGMGRTGKLFYYEYLGIKPDLLTIAKALGGGVPIGACLTAGIANDVLVPGDHGSTYGGNPFVCGVANAVVNEIVYNGIIENTNKMGKYALKKLNELAKKYDVIKEIRGEGLLIGISLNKDKIEASIFVKLAIENKLLLVSAGDNVVRYFPPLNVKKGEIDESIEKITRIINSFK